MPRKPVVAPQPAAAKRAKRTTADTVAAPKRTRPAAKPAVKSVVKAAAQALAAPAPKKAAARKDIAKKPAAKQAVKQAAKPAAPLSERAPGLAARPNLVRDSFTMPEHEYAVLLDVKQACLRAGIDVKKSELLRIGVALLGQLDVTTLQTVLAALPQLKTGRPPAGG